MYVCVCVCMCVYVCVRVCACVHVRVRLRIEPTSQMHPRRTRSMVTSNKYMYCRLHSLSHN